MKIFRDCDCGSLWCSSWFFRFCIYIWMTATLIKMLLWVIHGMSTY